MNKEKALNVLKAHQEWRTSNDEIKQTDHKELTKYLKMAIASMEQLNKELLRLKDSKD